MLRLILRRAARHGRMLGFARPFLAELAKTVIQIMGQHYDELQRREAFILQTIEQEEGRFSQTLQMGLALLDELIAGLKVAGQTMIPGEEAFRLYDTYGFPIDLTQDVARDQGLTVDMNGYQQALVEQRDRARSAAQFSIGESGDAQAYLDIAHDLKANGVLPFSGVQQACYGEPQLRTVIAGFMVRGRRVERAGPGDEVEVIVPITPFYIESGGQVSDTGAIEQSVEVGTPPAWEIQVTDVRRPVPGLIVHLGRVLRGSPAAGDPARVTVDLVRRLDIMRNHTASHLLQAVLRSVLGEHVHQAGSVVEPDRMRFDFTHSRALNREELGQVERLVNDAILADYPVQPIDTHYREAVAGGAMALFTEKYGDEVRVIHIGEGGGRIQQRTVWRDACHAHGTDWLVSYHCGREHRRRSAPHRCGYRPRSSAVGAKTARRYRPGCRAARVRADELEIAVRRLQEEFQAEQKEVSGLRGTLARLQAAVWPQNANAWSQLRAPGQPWRLLRRKWPAPIWIRCAR